MISNIVLIIIVNKIIIKYFLFLEFNFQYRSKIIKANILIEANYIDPHDETIPYFSE